MDFLSYAVKVVADSVANSNRKVLTEVVSHVIPSGLLHW